MNTAKKYQNSDGDECTINQMVRDEPVWAASRIQAGEYAILLLAEIKAWDIEQFKEHGSYTIPTKLREKIRFA